MMSKLNLFFPARDNIVSTCSAFLLLGALIFPGNTDISVLLISCCFMVLCFISFLVVLRNQNVIQISAIHGFLFAWLLWIIIPITQGWVTNTALFGVFQCSLWVIVCAIYSSSRSTSRLWTQTIYIGWALGLLDACYALWQFFVLHDMPSGFFPGKNTTGAFMMSMILLLAGEYLALPEPLSQLTQTKRSSAFFSYGLALSLFFMTFTMLIVLSRGVLLSFLFLMVGLITFTWNQLTKKRLRSLLVIFMMNVAAVLITAQPALLHRLDMLQHEKSRLIIWKGAWHLWEAIPWYGIGIFNFMRYYPAFSLPGDGSTLEYAHNDLLQLLIETGIPGIILLIGLCIVLIRAFWFYSKNPCATPSTHIKVISCFAALTALFAHSFVDFNFYIIFLNILMGSCLGFFKLYIYDARYFKSVENKAFAF